MSAKHRITILADNRAKEGLVEEHGLSFWIETPGLNILFDTGQGKALEPNARALGVDLRRTDTLVLSHGHWDHTGGVPNVVKTTPNLRVVCHPGFRQPRYSVAKGLVRSIGVQPESLAALDSLPAGRIRFITEPTRLSEHVGLTGEVPRLTEFEDTGGPFYLDEQGERPDLLEDDMSLWIDTDAGVVVCLGCCHSGVVNTLKHILRISGRDRVRAVIGGMHLLRADERRLKETVAALLALEPELIAPCHCTGEESMDYLKDQLKERVKIGKAGDRFEF